MTRHFLSLQDLEHKTLDSIVDRAIELKRQRGTDAHPSPLRGKSIALVFEKASTRTRISFEVGVQELGGYPLVIAARDSQLGRGEPIEDTARMLSGYAHGVVYRTHGHERLETLRDHSNIPVINGLSDRFHPCQLLADLQTLKEEYGKLRGLRVAWIGDGNNMAHSWILAAAMVGIELRLACPIGYVPDPEIVNTGQALAKQLGLGGNIVVTQDPHHACDGVDVVTTDVWTSMGQEAENSARLRAFSGFGVDAHLMSAARSSAIFLHCLPAHRGEEVTAEVLEGPQTRVWPQAENRLHAQKALLDHIFS